MPPRPPELLGEVGQLLAKGKVLKCKVRAAMDAGTQGSKKSQDQGNHSAMMNDGERSRPSMVAAVAVIPTDEK